MWIAKTGRGLFFQLSFAKPLLDTGPHGGRFQLWHCQKLDDIGNSGPAQWKGRARTQVKNGKSWIELILLLITSGCCLLWSTLKAARLHPHCYRTSKPQSRDGLTHPQTRVWHQHSGRGWDSPYTGSSPATMAEPSHHTAWVDLRQYFQTFWPISLSQAWLLVCTANEFAQTKPHSKC